MTASSTSNSSEMAALSAFSYAQAAKGQGASPSNTSSNPPPQSASSQPDSTATKSATPAESTADTTETSRASDVRSAVPDKMDTDSVPRSESDVQSESNQGKRSESRRDEEVSRLDRPWRRNDKSTRSSSAATRSVDEHDSRKPRKGKKSRPSDKQAGDQASTADKDQEPEPEAPKIELSEAPIPSVNPWLQRLVKPSPAPAATAPEASNGSPTPAQDSQKAVKPVESTSTAAPSAAVNGVKPQRKTADAARPERNGSRGSRQADKEGRDGKTEVPPPVGDSASWPTPEIAIKADTKKPADKVERPEANAQDDGSQAKHRKDKWVTYDYVPTVSFETQLPQLRGPKPRGGARGANGTRTAAGGQAGDKTASSATASNKNSESRDRPREAANGPNGTATAPAAGKRASIDVSSTREARKPAAHAEQSKDSQPTDQGKSSRDRPEGRGERGRGGYRGRGGHHAVNAHPQHQHAASAVNPAAYPTAGPVPFRPQGPYSPPPRQNSNGQGYMPPPQQRGGRGGRNGAGGNYHRMSLPNGRIPPVQTQFGPYEYPMPPMSAMPFQSPSYWENAGVLPVLKTQIEYYFSIENLCKDMFLRSHMDSQGFVQLHFVAAFKRVRNLSGDMSLVRAACEESTELDYVVGEDDVERLRRRDNWERWVLAYSERDELARNEGPVHISYKSNRYHFGHQFNGMAAPYGISSPPAYPGYGEAPFPQYVEGPHNGYPLNGGMNGIGNGHGSTQLSAEVPDFSPSGNFTMGAAAGATPASEKSPNVHVSAALDALNGNGDGHGANGLTNGVHSSAQDPVQS